MRSLLVSFCALAALAACSPATSPAPERAESAAAEPADALSITNAWARPSPGGVTVAAGYFIVTNPGTADDQLIDAASPRAASVELHTMTMQDNVMEMRPATSFPVPAGGSLELAPGGAHLMFIGVTEPFALGESVPVTLTFANAGTVDAMLTVTATAPAAEHAH